MFLCLQRNEGRRGENTKSSGAAAQKERTWTVYCAGTSLFSLAAAVQRDGGGEGEMEVDKAEVQGARAIPGGAGARCVCPLSIGLQGSTSEIVLTIKAA